MADMNTSPASATDVNDNPNGAPSSADAQTPPSLPAPPPPPTATVAPPAATATGDPQQQQQTGDQQGSQPKTPDLSKTPQPAQPAISPEQQQEQVQQQQVQKAGHMYQVMQALAGGPQYKTTIDPNTGTATRAAVPMSKGRIGMVLALEAITGALSGLAQTGPGAIGKAGAAGVEQGEQIAQQRQQGQQQQDQQAQQDYARHAQVFQNNLKMLSMAQIIGKQDFDSNQAFAAQYKPLADQLREDHPEAILGVGPESDAAKYHATKDMGMPTGNVTPVFDPKTGQHAVGAAGNKLWQLEYMFINPNFSGENFLTDADRSAGEKYGILPKDLPTNLQTRITMAMDYKHRIASATLGDQNVQGFYTKLGQKPPDFAALVKQDPTLVATMEKFQPLLAATGGNYEHAIGELAAGDKASERKPDPNAAGKILNLYGGTDMVHKFDQQTTDEAEKHKSDLETQAAVAKQNALAPGEVKLAKDKATAEVAPSGSKAFTEGFNHQKGADAAKTADGVPVGGGSKGSSGEGSIDYFTKDDPQLAALIKPENLGSDGINHAFLDAFTQKNPRLGPIVDQIIHGRNTTSKYGTAKVDGIMLDNAVAAASPSYNKNMAEAYSKTLHDFSTGGNMGKALVNGNTAFDHLANLYDASDALTTGAIPGFKTVGDWLESKKAGSFATDAANAPQELGSLYANGGAAHEDDVKAYRSAYQGPPSKVKGAVVQQMVNAMDKMEELANSYYSSVPSTFDKPQTFLSPKAAANYTRITGKPVDPKLINHGKGPAPQVDPRTPAGAVPAWSKSTGKQLGYKGTDGNVVYFPGGPQASIAPHPSSPYQYVSPSGQHGWDGQQWVPIQGAASA